MTSKKIILRNLLKFGFTKSQAKLYFAGIELKQSLMAPLARQAKIKRTTVYYIMKELLRRRFFEKKLIGRRTYYLAATPKKLIIMAKEREKLLKKLYPALNKIYTS